MKMLVMANKYPYNNMVFDNRLQVGEFAVKTRSYNLNYRGPVLFYNSGRIEPLAMKAYGYQRSPLNHKVIIGMAELVEVRPLTIPEGKIMVKNFNHWTQRELTRFTKQFYLPGTCVLDIDERDWQDWPFWINTQWDYSDIITPYRIGLFFKNKKRFDKPIPFNWPAGPVRPIQIQSARYPKLHAQILIANNSRS